MPCNAALGVGIHREANLLRLSLFVLFAVSSTVGTSLCTSLVSLRQNQLCQQSITATERSCPQWPFTVVAFETQCLSHSCSTPFKYFKWVRCGAITWLLDKHQFIHQAGNRHTAARFYFACSSLVRMQGKATNSKHYWSFLKLHKPLRNKMGLSWMFFVTATLKGQCMTLDQAMVRKIWPALKIYSNSPFTAVSTKQDKGHKVYSTQWQTHIQKATTNMTRSKC